ncbi:ANTAR domain-containing response regulator [Streptomyces lanatus]|uniref:ANTAR domain-containing response regulator n=1 Tax=Streptomyces lanatus TaxID=66900 RepID=UPI003570E407
MNHEEQKDLRDEVDQLRRAMETRPAIDQARGILMASFGLSPEDAWTVLVSVSQNTNTKLHSLADELVTTVQGGALSETMRQQVSAALTGLEAATESSSETAP